MRRTLNWLGSLFWQQSYHEYPDEAVVEIIEPVVTPVVSIPKHDLINPLENPIDLPANFDPETLEGWNFMLRILDKQGWLKCQPMILGGFQTNVNGKLIKEAVFKINSIALGDNKHRQEEVNHAILHDIKRPVIHGQFYSEVYRLFSCYLRPIYCRRSVITFLCIRAYCAEGTFLYTGGDHLRSFKWLPKEIVALIGKYLMSTKYEQCWDIK